MLKESMPVSFLVLSEVLFLRLVVRQIRSITAYHDRFELLANLTFVLIIKIFLRGYYEYGYFKVFENYLIK